MHLRCDEMSFFSCVMFEIERQFYICKNCRPTRNIPFSLVAPLAASTGALLAKELMMELLM